MKKICLVIILSLFFVPYCADAVTRGNKTFFGPESGKTVLTDQEKATKYNKEQTEGIKSMIAVQSETNAKLETIINEIRNQTLTRKDDMTKILEEFVRVLKEQNALLQQLVAQKK